jgi:hypothetical protein
MVLIIGGKGSIGRRYQAVLKHLKRPFEIYDLGDELPVGNISHVIITSPTEKHLEHVLMAMRYDCPILCEKPLSMDLNSAKKIAKLPNVYVVNNYAYVTRDAKSIRYDFYNTGRDGFIWDLCQLVYIAKKNNAHLNIKRSSYTWTLIVDDEPVPYSMIEYSYRKMIQDFLNGNRFNLWSAEEGYEMSLACAEIVQRGGNECESYNWYPSENKFEAPSQKDLSDDWK